MESETVERFCDYTNDIRFIGKQDENTAGWSFSIYYLNGEGETIEHFFLKSSGAVDYGKDTYYTNESGKELYDFIRSLDDPDMIGYFRLPPEN